MKLMIIAMLILMSSACSQTSGLIKKESSNKKQVYAIYTAAGSAAGYSEMLEELLKSDYVLLGEHHNDALIHWLHYQIVKDLAAERSNKITIGVEFFERDDQLIIDEYMSGLYDETRFLAEAKLWQNYKTDYKPVLEFAHKNKIPYIATNIPRRYASMINKKGLIGLDSIDQEAMQYIAPIPFPTDTTISTYNSMYHMMKLHGGTWKTVYAQMSKDATMAWFSTQNKEADRLFIHIQGSGHSDSYAGIGRYIKHYAKDARVKTVSISPQADINQLADDKKNVADFIIVVPEDFTKTY